jgi:hypothetical protein
MSAKQFSQLVSVSGVLPWTFRSECGPDTIWSAPVSGAARCWVHEAQDNVTQPQLWTLLRLRLAHSGLMVLLVSMLTCASSTFLASAATISLSTGLDGTGNVQSSSGALDANWNVSSQPAQVVTSSSADYWFIWPANDSRSSWIARDASNSNNGTGIYTRTFDLAGLDLSTVSISGHWAVDDEGTLSLNGHQIGAYQPHDGWQNWATQTFSVNNSSSWFNQGVNSLVLTIANTDNFFEGVRLEGALTALAVPEPGSIALVSSVALLSILRRRFVR